MLQETMQLLVVGISNNATGGSATVGGGYQNEATGTYSTVAGGNINNATALYATVGGGVRNNATGNYATVAGGSSNEATVDRATVGGGSENDAKGTYATISGGYSNDATAADSTVGGGSYNNARGARSTIPGGYDNTASGEYSFTVGRGCQADGNYSVAIGNTLSATNDGSWVIGDSNAGGTPIANRSSTKDDRFYGFFDNGYVLFTTEDGTDATGVYVLAGGNAWNSVSDKTKKENYKTVNKQDILNKLIAMPIEEWNYKSQDESIRHIDPYAQDFDKAFGLGESELSIDTIDADGVALEAAQALAERNKKLEAKVTALEYRLKKLESLFK